MPRHADQPGPGVPQIERSTALDASYSVEFPAPDEFVESAAGVTEQRLAAAHRQFVNPVGPEDVVDDIGVERVVTRLAQRDARRIVGFGEGIARLQQQTFRDATAQFNDSGIEAAVTSIAHERSATL